MDQDLLKIKNDASSLIIAAEDERELNQIKLDFLGKSGKLSCLVKGIKDVPEDRRPEIGRLANEILSSVEELLERRFSEFSGKKKEILKKMVFDISRPGIKPEIGHLHPMSQVIYDVVEVFKGLGYQAADGPEIETDYYNFEALNIPRDHPARDTQQTFYLDTRKSHVSPGEVILRTQTSSMQGRVMEKVTPPIRVIVPGKNFRYEQVNVSHGFEFWQVEGFLVDTNVRLTDLFGTIDYVLRKLMGENLPAGRQVKIRFATTNFPFVEPGVDTYIECTVCHGKGCSFCKNSGWSEIMPAGMIHPNVLKAVGYDSQKVSGFAFAIGLSRLVTLRYQMDDLRLLTNPDLRILEQF